jgi:hypothetical protein
MKLLIGLFYVAFGFGWTSAMTEDDLLVEFSQMFKSRARYDKFVQIIYFYLIFCCPVINSLHLSFLQEHTKNLN